MDKSKINDPFENDRLEKGFGEMDDQNDPVVMVLGHKDVRRCAHNWKTYQSGAEPGRIVIPSEVNIRDTRQIPFELDPPMHGDYRALLDQWFKRPLEAEYEAELKKQISTLFDEVLTQDKTEVIHDFSLKLQSRALTLLFNVPFSVSETWISWGTHVFRSEATALDASKANILYAYIDEQIDKSINNPGDDFYSKLLASQVNGKKLTKEEIKGIVILTFAGGRDTVINAVTNSIAYFAEHPESLERLRKEPELTTTAIEELVRYFSPLTQMGRVATEDATVCEHAVKADTRISLNWASANRDAKVFENANEVVIDRKINPHVAFGFGTHNCLGATHARQILKILIHTLIEKVESIEILDYKENIEDLGDYKRKVGFDKINVKFNSKLN
ncbi:cytochrome p450 [Formosa agariphila KMM 3901]|uniref:Cytochrome p450 n=1 Tax=Formosa agariphila (strain DSM 15362 / KCTC 12365 / LMG 23005 / KMM 3901 / M-2Alg 35-1) TaxID=1347342 RepID=T2KLQ7_FORAG|nr:cytochrome P450 [Formosa agariphila]CDF79812.1 cytochrome p450 [Formosa agariphila KMM 3901]